MLFTVYTPDGEMFEVSAKIAKNLIINRGWSPTKPALGVSTLPLFAERDDKSAEDK